MTPVSDAGCNTPRGSSAAARLSLGLTLALEQVAAQHYDAMAARQVDDATLLKVRKQAADGLGAQAKIVRHVGSVHGQLDFATVDAVFACLAVRQGQEEARQTLRSRLAPQEEEAILSGRELLAHDAEEAASGPRVSVEHGFESRSRIAHQSGIGECLNTVAIVLIVGEAD